MEFSRRQNDQSRATSNVESAIVDRLEDYRRSLDAGLKIPETTVPLLVGKGRMLVQADPQKFEATACALMDSALRMEPAQANRFLSEQVTAETFEFQLRFDALRSPSDVSLSGICGIHVNSEPVLANLRNKEESRSAVHTHLPTAARRLSLLYGDHRLVQPRRTFMGALQ